MMELYGCYEERSMKLDLVTNYTQGFSEHLHSLMKGFHNLRSPWQIKSVPRSNCVLEEEKKCRENRRA